MEGYEMITLAEFEKFLHPEPTDESTVAFFRKGFDSGNYDHLTKTDFHELSPRKFRSRAKLSSKLTPARLKKPRLAARFTRP
jgi:hypothetical protein